MDRDQLLQDRYEQILSALQEAIDHLAAAKAYARRWDGGQVLEWISCANEALTAAVSAVPTREDT